MSQQNKIGTHKTSIFAEDGLMRVVYHETAVVSFNDSKIILNTGGWQTNTTKTRMNQTSNQFALGFQVYQKNFDWFVSYKNQTIKFEGETLELDRNAEYPQANKALERILNA